jgi:hypothetical protein
MGNKRLKRVTNITKTRGIKKSPLLNFSHHLPQPHPGLLLPMLNDGTVLGRK